MADYKPPDRSYDHTREQDRRYAGATGDNHLPSIKNLFGIHVWEPGLFLKAALACADALLEYHSRGLVHGHINPGNIKWDELRQEVQLEDTGRDPHRLVEADLPYISPEQTGRSNRAPDCRSDLYSLGVVLYELATGLRPFEASNTLEWVRQHMVCQPRNPAEIIAGLPPVISDIIMKLLAKDPVKRYQSAGGLRADLERCWREWQSQGEFDRFQLGGMDLPGEIRFSRKLYGRSKALDRLQKAYKRICSGQRGLVMVTGPVGIGKSMLIQEINRFSIKQGAVFAGGRFDTLNPDVPCGGFVSVLRELVRYLLMGDPRILERWRMVLQNALGSSGQLLIDIVPEAELLIGQQPQQPKLNSEEGKNRFNLLLQDFIQVFTSRDQSLVICLDDLDHADLSALQLMKNILLDMRKGYLLVVGTSQNAAGEHARPLSTVLEELRQAGVMVEGLELEPLGPEELEAMLADMLRCPPRECSSLARLLTEKTLGNPYYANQLLQQLFNEGKLFADYEQNCWRWDQEAVQSLEISPNVADYLKTKISGIDKRTRQLLGAAACTGTEFEAFLLADLCGWSPQETEAVLEVAVDEGLVEYARPVYALSKPEAHMSCEGKVYRFSHKIIQEAAYELLEPGERAQMHGKIGLLLLSDPDVSSSPESFFQLVEHLNRSLDLVAEEVKRPEISRLNLEAGKKARIGGANEQAVYYFTRGIESLSEGAWEEHFELAFELHKGKAEGLFLLGQHLEAQGLFDLLVSRCRTAVEKASIYNLMIVLHALMGRFKENREAGTMALRMFGYQIPEPDDGAAISQDVQRLMASCRESLEKLSIKGIMDIPVQDSPERSICSQIVMNMLIPAFVSSAEWFSLLTLIALDNLLERGVKPEDDYVLASSALVLGTYLRDYRSARDLVLLALDLNDKSHSISTRALICHVASFMVLHWVLPYKEALPYNREAFKAALAAGDYVSGVYATIGWMRMLLSFSCRDLRTVLEESDQASNYYYRIQDFTSIARQKMFRHVILNLMGDTESIDSFSSADFNEEKHLAKMRALNHGTAIINYFLYKSLSSCLYGKPEKALIFSEEGEAYLPYLTSFPMEVDYAYVQSLSLLAVMRKNMVPAPEKEAQYRARLASNMSLMQIWADSCPVNYLCRYALVRAEKEALDGEALAAQEWFETAIEAAHDSGQLLYEALALEHAADHYQERGLKRLSFNCRREARDVYWQWGARGKVRLMEEAYPELRQDKESLASGRIKCPMDRLDTETVVRASQAISEEILLPRLLDTLLNTVIESAGAHRAVLLLASGDEWTVRAEARDSNMDSWSEDSSRYETRPGEEPGGVEVPLSMINLVGRTRDTVILDDASQFHSFYTDPYFVHNHPHSVLCLPLIRQGKTAGILYLENFLSTAAFTPGCIAILEMLAAQAVISLENAILYEQHIEMEKELSALNQRLFDIIESLPDATFVVDSERRVIAWNRALEELTGVDKSQVLGQGHDVYASAFYSYERPLLLDLVLDKESSFETSYDFVSRGQDTAVAESYLPLVRGGQGAYLLGSASIIRDSRGNMAGAIETVRDISARKAAEEALRISERRLADIVDFLPDATMVVDADQRVMLWNKAMERMTGVKAGEICGKGHYEYALPFYGERRPLMLDLMMHPDEKYEKQYLWTRQEGNTIFGESLLENGRYYLTAAAILRDSQGQISGAIETVRDITEPRQASEEIKRLRNLLRNIIDSMPMILVGTDKEGRVSMWNAEAARQTGLQSEQVLGRHVDQVLSLSRRQMERLIRALEENTAMQTERIISIVEGEKRYRDFTVYPLTDPLGGDLAEGAVVRIDDVSDQIQMQEMITQSEKMMSVGGLAAGMAHELNNPLSGIIQATQNIVNRLAPELPRNREAAEKCGTSIEAVRAYLEMRSILDFVQGIRDSGIRAAAIISNMLQFSRRSEARKERVLLTDLLEKTLELAANDYDLARGFDFRHVEIVRDYGPEPLEIECVATEIEQVVLNLVKNSAHAMAEKPCPNKLPRIILRVRREDEMAVIEVEDNGPGMEEAVKKRIFEPFFTTKAPGLGTGLGLSVSYFIVVNNHNGRMAVESHPGQGTRIILNLPL